LCCSGDRRNGRSEKVPSEGQRREICENVDPGLSFDIECPTDFREVMDWSNYCLR
jgi:hypothetical protein